MDHIKAQSDSYRAAIHAEACRISRIVGRSIIDLALESAQENGGGNTNEVYTDLYRATCEEVISLLDPVADWLKKGASEL